jgi:hypothetical protein
MRRRDFSLTFAVCASLGVHAWGLHAIIAAERDAMDRRTQHLSQALRVPHPIVLQQVPKPPANTTPKPPTAAQRNPAKPPTARPVELLPPPPAAMARVLPALPPPPPPEADDERQFGEASGTGAAINSSPGNRSIQARQSPHEQAFLSRDPVGNGQVGAPPTMVLNAAKAPADGKTGTTPDGGRGGNAAEQQRALVAMVQPTAKPPLPVGVQPPVAPAPQPHRTSPPPLVALRPDHPTEQPAAQAPSASRQEAVPQRPMPPQPSDAVAPSAKPARGDAPGAVGEQGNPVEKQPTPPAEQKPREGIASRSDAPPAPPAPQAHPSPDRPNPGPLTDPSPPTPQPPSQRVVVAAAPWVRPENDGVSSPVTVTPRAAAEAAGSGGSTKAGEAGAANDASAADPAPMSDSESDAFSREGSAEFVNGRLEPRFGRRVKTVRPSFDTSGRLDLYGMKDASVQLAVHTDVTGKPTFVEVIKSSGSNSIDQPVKLALYKWWFEPPKDKDGKPKSDVTVWTIHFR